MKIFAQNPGKDHFQEANNNKFRKEGQVLVT